MAARLIISAHTDELIKLQQSHNDRPASLRYIYDRISAHVLGLALLGISTEQYGSLLIPVVMSKVPNEIRLQVARSSTDDIWKIEYSLNTIKKEVEVGETSEHVKTSEGSRKPFFWKTPNSIGKLAGRKQNTRESSEVFCFFFSARKIIILPPVKELRIQISVKNPGQGASMFKLF